MHGTLETLEQLLYNNVFNKTNFVITSNVDNVFIAFSIDIPFAVLSHYPLSSYTAETGAKETKHSMDVYLIL
jgi:hypothetical protein